MRVVERGGVRHPHAGGARCVVERLGRVGLVPRQVHVARLERHRAEIRAETSHLGWSFLIHRTDRPASELVLALHARMGEGHDTGYRMPVRAAASRSPA